MICPVDSPVIVALRFPFTAALLATPSLADFPRKMFNRRLSNLTLDRSRVLTSAVREAAKNAASGSATAAVLTRGFIRGTSMGNTVLYTGVNATRWRTSSLQATPERSGRDFRTDRRRRTAT